MMVQIYSDKRNSTHSLQHYYCYPYCRRRHIPSIQFLLLILPLLQILSSTSIIDDALYASALLIPQFTNTIRCRRHLYQIRRTRSFGIDNGISRLSSSSSIIAAKKNKITTIVCAGWNEGDEKMTTEKSPGKSKNEEQEAKKKKREDVMAFLRKAGRVGGNKDFSTAIGVDEGPAGVIKSGVSEAPKGASAYKWCTETGIIDDMSENFPRTSSGTEWSGFTDKVMGGVSEGKLIREVVDGRNVNVMKGKVSLYNNGGFIQMAASLSKDPAVSLNVDASTFDGVELDVLYRGDEDIEKFNVHLRNPACIRQFSSYRSTFEVGSNKWETVRLPWSSFIGYGPGSDGVPFDTSELRRIGIVAIGKAMEVYLAVSSVRFYKIE